MTISVHHIIREKPPCLTKVLEINGIVNLCASVSKSIDSSAVHMLNVSNIVVHVVYARKPEVLPWTENLSALHSSYYWHSFPAIPPLHNYMTQQPQVTLSRADTPLELRHRLLLYGYRDFFHKSLEDDELLCEFSS